MRPKLTELQRGIDESTPIVRDFNTPLSEMDRFSMQKISKDTDELNSNINQLDMTDIYREKTQITNIRNEGEDITTDPIDIKRIINKGILQKTLSPYI